MCLHFFFFQNIGCYHNSKENIFILSFQYEKILHEKVQNSFNKKGLKK